MAWSNAKPNVPPLFREIVKNDARRAEIKAMPVVPWERAQEHAALVREKRDFRQAAEKALRWNADKGNMA